MFNGLKALAALRDRLPPGEAPAPVVEAAPPVEAPEVAPGVEAAPPVEEAPVIDMEAIEAAWSAAITVRGGLHVAMTRKAADALLSLGYRGVPRDWRGAENRAKLAGLGPLGLVFTANRFPCARDGFRRAWLAAVDAHGGIEAVCAEAGALIDAANAEDDAVAAAEAQRWHEVCAARVRDTVAAHMSHMAEQAAADAADTAYVRRSFLD